MKTRKEKEKAFIKAFFDFVIDCNENEEEDEEDTDTQYNQMLAELCINEELKQLVNKLVPHKDADDAWGELLLQVAEIKDKQKVLDVWNKRNREFHWYMVRVICNQFKSNTSHFYRQYRRKDHMMDDNSHTIIEMANDIGYTDTTADGYVIDEIQSKLTEEIDWNEIISNQQIMDEVNWFVKNNLNWYEQEMYRMYYIEELSHVKISNITRIPATSVGNTIRNILAMITHHLMNKGILNNK